MHGQPWCLCQVIQFGTFLWVTMDFWVHLQCKNSKEEMGLENMVQIYF
jgi:hypothetical protein